MILEYHRPNTLEQALDLLARAQPLTLPLGGGTVLNAPCEARFAVVDLQNLGLNTIATRGSVLDVGATVTLQQLLETPELQPDLQAAIRHEATYNLRQAGTVAGTLVAADGRSPFAAAMLALDPVLTLLPDERQTPLGDLLHLRTPMPTPSAAQAPLGTSSQSPDYPITHYQLPNALITHIQINTKPALAYHYVARAPADRPVVCVAAARWPSGRVRVVVGGWGDAPRLALDAAQPDGVEEAVRSVAAEAGDQWASAEYRQDVAVTLARRALESVLEEA